MPYLEVPNASLWYSDSRQEEGVPTSPVVFLHADTGSSQSWSPQVGTFMENGFRCISYDHRGRGRSKTSLPRIPPGVGLADLVALLDKLEIEKTHFVATARGAFDAIEFSASYPDRVNRLVLANTVGGITDDWYATILNAMWTPEILALPADQLELSPAYRGENPAGRNDWIKLHEHACGPGAPMHDSEGNSTFADLQQLTMPVMLIAGEADLLAPPALMRHLQDHIEGSRFSVIPDSGHSSSWEAPELFNRRVLDFLLEDRKGR